VKLVAKSDALGRREFVIEKDDALGFYLKREKGQSQVLTQFRSLGILWPGGQTVAYRVSGGNLSCA
jgi:hypothetical protein